jgi:hypothetical protein
MSYLSNLVAFLSVNTLTKSQNINPNHPIHDESTQHKHNIGLITYQSPTIDPQIPVGFKYSPPFGPNQQQPPPPPTHHTIPRVLPPIVIPGIPNLLHRKGRRHPLRPPSFFFLLQRGLQPSRLLRCSKLKVKSVCTTLLTTWCYSNPS